MIRSFVVRFRRATAAAAAIACGLVPSSAMAVSCSVSTLAANFGAYNPLVSTPLSTTGTINVACTCTAAVDCVAFAYRIEVSPGQSGNTAAREMWAGAGRLQYNLYSDPGFSSVWGTGNAGVSVLYLVALFGSTQTAPIYARVPAGQVVPAGSYTDSPVVTVFY